MYQSTRHEHRTSIHFAFESPLNLHLVRLWVAERIAAPPSDMDRETSSSLGQLCCGPLPRGLLPVQVIDGFLHVSSCLEKNPLTKPPSSVPVAVRSASDTPRFEPTHKIHERSPPSPIFTKSQTLSCATKSRAIYGICTM